MRTTVTLAPDVQAELDRLRRISGLGPSAAVNQLVRRGMAASSPAAGPYEHRSFGMGQRVDVSNIGGVLDLLDRQD
ncbi:MAG: CopG family transcriptional regulator [Brachybacterium sp.]|nr:CopG family transcriptional regulator [Brachybacterium sp.]